MYVCITRTNPTESSQPSPTPQDPPQLLRRQQHKRTGTQIQIGRLTPHAPIHNHHVHTLIPLPAPLISLHPYPLPAQRVLVRVRPPAHRGVKDLARDGHDRVVGRGRPAAGAEGGGVVGQVAGVDARRGREGEGCGGGAAAGEADGEAEDEGEGGEGEAEEEDEEGGAAEAEVASVGWEGAVEKGWFMIGGMV